MITRGDSTASDALVGELQQHCKSRLERFQYPHLIEFVPGLPKTVTGKIQRCRLREESLLPSAGFPAPQAREWASAGWGRG